MPKLKIHEAALAFPKLKPKERAELKASLETNGQTHPIILVNDEIADGRHRYELCEELGIEPWLETRNGDTSAAAVAEGQMQGRQYKPGMHAMIAARLKPIFAEEIREKERARKKGQPRTSANSQKSVASAQAAEATGVSTRTVDAAAKVVEHGTPELQEAVEEGKIGVEAAAQLSELPKEQQEEVVAAGPKAMREMAKEMREPAPPPPPSHPYSDRFNNLLKAIVCELEEIHIECGKLPDMVKETKKWDTWIVKNSLVPLFHSLGNTFEEMSKEIAKHGKKQTA